jgi:hypothetical protein
VEGMVSSKQPRKHYRSMIRLPTWRALGRSCKESVLPLDYVTRVRLVNAQAGQRKEDPMYATVKINVDGAYNPVTGEAAVGMIARDHGDNPQVMAWRLISNSRDAEEAKALVCLEGVKLLHHWPEPCPGGAGDRLHNGRSNHRDCSVISAIIGDIKEIMQSRRTCRIQKVWREQNRIATICYEVW